MKKTRPGDMAAVTALLQSIAAGKPAWRLLRDAEIMRGYQWVPVGSVAWLSLADWHEHDCVSINGDEVRLIAIAARKPGSGAFTRLVTAVLAAGMMPVVVCPLGHMTAILTRWGWQRIDVGSTFTDREEQWRPGSLAGALGGARALAGTITRPEAASPSGGPVRPAGGENGGNDG